MWFVLKLLYFKGVLCLCYRLYFNELVLWFLFIYINFYCWYVNWYIKLYVLVNYDKSLLLMFLIVNW